MRFRSPHRHARRRGVLKKPSVLVIAYHFPPEASIGTHRTLRLVRRLVDDGWDVTVLTGTATTYPSSCPMDADLLSSVPPAVRIVRARALRPFENLSRLLKRGAKVAPAVRAASMPDEVGAPDGPTGLLAGLRGAKQWVEGVLRIPDPNIGWFLPALAAGLAASFRQWPDVVYATAPPWTGQLIARALSSVLGCAWLADFRDPWARAPWREGRLPIARRAAEILERTVVKRADAIVFTTRTNMDEYAAFYGPSIASKLHLVRNGCDRSEFDGLAAPPPDGRFTMLHAGSLYGGRKPTALFAALAALQARGVINAETFCFRQIGRVTLTGFDMVAERDRLGLQGLVEVLPPQPRRDILREMLSASCLLLLQPGTTVSIPGKLFEYMAAGRPILAIAENGETANLVRASAGGLAVLPDDQRGIEQTLESLIASRSAGIAATPRELFDGELRTRELVAVLDSLISRRMPARQAYRVSPESTEVRP